MNERKVIFIDRDGVINKMTLGEYVLTWGQFEFLPGAKAGLKALTDNGYEIYIITNQAGVGKGLMAEADLAAIHKNMLEELSESGVVIAGIYHCPHRTEDGCDCRKPKPGMFFRAAHEHDIDLSKVWYIGDNLRNVDKEAGDAAGVRTIVMETNGNLSELVDTIL